MMPRRSSRIGQTIGLITVFAALAPAPRAVDGGPTLRELAASRAEVSRKIIDFYVDLRLVPPNGAGKSPTELFPDGELVETWARRNVDARLDAAERPEDRIAILKSDLDRTLAIEAKVKELTVGNDQITQLDPPQGRVLPTRRRISARQGKSGEVTIRRSLPEVRHLTSVEQQRGGCPRPRAL